MKLFKNYRKPSLVLCLLLLFAGLWLFSPSRALAIPNPTQAENCANNLVYQDMAHIVCSVKGLKITFVDKDPTDDVNNGNGDYVASVKDYASESSAGAFCGTNKDSLTYDSRHEFSNGTLGLSDTGSSLSVHVIISYKDPASKKAGCAPYDNNGNKVALKDTGKLNVLLAGHSNSAVPLRDVSKDSKIGKVSYSRLLDSDNVPSYDPSTTRVLFKSSDYDLANCNGSLLVVVVTGTTGGLATEYDLSSSGTALNSVGDFSNPNFPSNVCGVGKLNFGLGGDLSDLETFQIAPAISGIVVNVSGRPCTAGQTKPGYTCSCTVDGGHTTCVWVPKSNPGGCTDPTDPTCTNPGGGGSGTTCENNASGFSLSWLMCPVLDAASGLTNALINLFEDQLSFRVDNLSSTGNDQVHASWATIRDVSSSVLVVFMLVMVLSQAISWGPFDAYTIKKLLPKMVVAIILMQISWDLFSYIVNLVDDIGHGLANLMYLPFNGASQMTIWNLLKNANLKGVVAGSLNWGAFAVGAFLTYSFIFTMLGTATVAILALLSGLFTLIFRKILIIALLILSPLALVAWILPGTQNYWKMWRENFTKALMMYPLVVGLIASGRIFCYIAGTSKDVSHGGTFLNLIFILVGYFGPLFLLPKCFKWGGQAMQLAGNASSKVGSKIAERPKKFFDKRQEQWNGIRTQRSQMRVMEQGTSLKKGWSKNPIKSGVRALDLMKAGKLDPTRLGQMQSDAEDAYIEHGEKRQAERRAAAAQRWQRSIEEQIDESAGVTKDEVYQAIADHKDITFKNYNGEEVTIKGSDISALDERVALDRLTTLGGGQNLRFIEKKFEEAMRSGNTRHAAEFRGFMNDNVQTLLPKMTHLYKGYGSTADASPEAISQMHGVEVEAMLAEFSHRIATGTDSRGRAVDVNKARAQLNNFLTRYAEAAADPQLRGRLEAGGLRAVAAFMSGDPTHELFTDPETGIQGGHRISRNGAAMQYEDHEAHTTRTLTQIDPTVASSVIDASLASQLQANVASRVGEQQAAAPAPQVSNPTQIKIQHQSAARSSLPDPASLAAPTGAGAAPNPARTAFKLQLENDPNAVEVLANNIAYGSAAPEYHEVLEEMRADAVSAGTPEAISAYNGLVARIQQAMQQRINQTAAAAAERGHDPATARTAATNRLAPQITDLESGGTINFRKI